MHKIMQIQVGGISSVHIKQTHEEKRDLCDLPWHDGWCKTDWVQYCCNCLYPGIFMHSLLSLFKKHPVSVSSADKNTLFVREVKGKRPGSLELTGNGNLDTRSLQL